MLFHLDLQPGLEHLLGQIRQQPARANEIYPVGAGLLDELLGQRPIRSLLGVVGGA